MAIKFTGIGHVSFRSKNFEKLDSFYQNVLELKKAFDKKDADGKSISTFYRLPSDQFVEVYHSDVENEEYTGDNKQCDRSHYHCCLEVDARHEAYRDMKRKNISLYRQEDDSVGMCGSWCSFIKDDEGNEWELMEFSTESQQLLGDDNNMKFQG